MFRTLRADEIELRVQMVRENGFTLLLYKDARADMNMLDETVGAMNWKREHSRDNANCTVSIYNKETGQWVGKEDTGTESFEEKEKGLASSSFKRACANWGIGRELYTASFIWINNEGEVQKNEKGKLYVKGKFEVKEIGYDNYRRINHLIIVDSKGKIRYKHNAPQAPPRAEKAVDKVEVEEEHTETTESLKCSSCGIGITEKVEGYSKEKYGKPLCYKCQKGAK